METSTFSPVTDKQVQIIKELFARGSWKDKNYLPLLKIRVRDMTNGRTGDAGQLSEKEATAFIHYYSLKWGSLSKGQTRLINKLFDTPPLKGAVYVANILNEVTANRVQEVELLTRQEASQLIRHLSKLAKSMEVPHENETV